MLTNSRVLLPLARIYSSSQVLSNPTNNFINNEKWCSKEDVDDVSEEYVGMNFTEPVVVTMLVSGGLDSSYVTNFSVYHTLSVTGDFQPYGELKPVQVGT